MINEIILKTGKISVMRDSRQVPLKIVLFQLRGCSHPQVNAPPNLFPDSNSSILGLSKEVSVVSEFL